MPIVDDGTGTGNEIVKYQGIFTVSAVDYGFDIVGAGYSRGLAANAQVKAVPWPSVAGVAQNVVIQKAGYQPMTRRYQAIFYTEQDFQNMMALVGAEGFLVTPRETIAIPAYLMSCQSQNSVTNNPSVEADLEFQVLPLQQ